jgi:hypothetical protein
MSSDPLPYPITKGCIFCPPPNLENDLFSFAPYTSIHRDEMFLKGRGIFLLILNEMSIDVFS